MNFILTKQIFWTQIFSGPQNFSWGTKDIFCTPFVWTKNVLDSNLILCLYFLSKKFSQKNLGWKKLLVLKNFGSKAKTFSPKKCGLQKLRPPWIGSKKFGQNRVSNRTGKINGQMSPGQMLTWQMPQWQLVHWIRLV